MCKQTVQRYPACGAVISECPIETCWIFEFLQERIEHQYWDGELVPQQCPFYELYFHESRVPRLPCPRCSNWVRGQKGSKRDRLHGLVHAEADATRLQELQERRTRVLEGLTGLRDYITHEEQAIGALYGVEVSLQDLFNRTLMRLITQPRSETPAMQRQEES